MMGLYYEELSEGQIFELGTHRFNAQRISDYSRDFAPVGFHLNDAEAAQGLFGKPAAAGFHTCSAWMICFVDVNTRARAHHAASGKKLPEVGPSPGLENIRWPRPVHADDVITYRSTVAGKRELVTKPGWGMVTIHNDGHNQLGELVMSFTGKVLVQRQP